MTNLDSILKSRDINLPTKVHLVKAMVFPGVMYGCESWTIKKAERWRMDALELWCEKTLEGPLDSKEIQAVHPKGNQSWYSLEGLMLKLKLQYFGHLMWRTDSLENTLMLGRIEGRRRRGWQKMKWLDGITDLIDMSLSKLWEWTGKPGVLQSIGFLKVRHGWATGLDWGPETRYFDLSWKIVGFGYVWVPARWVQVPEWVLAGFESQSEVNCFVLSSVEGGRGSTWAVETSIVTAHLWGSGSSLIQCLCPFLKMALLVCVFTILV